MAESDMEKVLVMAIFMVSRDDVMSCADELGMSQEQITEDVIERVREKVSQGLDGWRAVIKGMVKETISQEAVENEAIGCPLGMVCSPACAWREVGQCLLPGSAQ